MSDKYLLTTDNIWDIMRGSHFQDKEHFDAVMKEHYEGYKAFMLRTNKYMAQNLIDEGIIWVYYRKEK